MLTYKFDLSQLVPGSQLDLKLGIVVGLKTLTAWCMRITPESLCLTI
jgi:hypothetical protein